MVFSHCQSITPGRMGVSPACRQPFPAVLKPESGSVLVVVLWVLIMIGFLAGQYSAHNRGKADIARNAWAAFKQRQAVISMVQLFATDAWPLSDGTGADGRWFRLFPDDEQQVWIRVDKETSRVNLNTAKEDEIKQKIAGLLEDSRQRETDAVSDAILDWRDEDNLTRMHGAEEETYKSLGFTYRPADGPFNAMSELLLVRGVTQDLFWGDPVRLIEMDLSRRLARVEDEIVYSSLSETATIYANATRISLLVPGDENGYLYTHIFLDKEAGRFKVVGRLETLRFAEDGFDRLIELESEVAGRDIREKNRR